MQITPIFCYPANDIIIAKRIASEVVGTHPRCVRKPQPFTKRSL